MLEEFGDFFLFFLFCWVFGHFLKGQLTLEIDFLFFELLNLALEGFEFVELLGVFGGLMVAQDWEGLDAADFVVGEELVLLFEGVDFGEGLFGGALVVLDLNAEVVIFFLEMFVVLLEYLQLRGEIPRR